MRYGTRIFEDAGDFVEVETDDQNEFLINASSCFGLCQQAIAMGRFGRFQIRVGEGVTSERDFRIEPHDYWWCQDQNEIAAILWACHERGLK